jgi:hypothetical protein
MDLRPQLRALPDDDNASASLPPDIAAACERDRLRANYIVRLILHSPSIPAVDESIAFSVTDSAEQRKMLAERYEDTVREIADRKRTAEIRASHADGPTDEHPTTGDATLDSALASPETARKLFRSLWALDRIVGYLAWDHMFADTPGAAELLVQRASSELETMQAQDVDPNPLPLQYSLHALASALCGQAQKFHDFPAITQLCARIDEAIDASRTSDGEPMIDRGKQLRAVLATLRQTLGIPPVTPITGTPVPSLAGTMPDPLEDA